MLTIRTVSQAQDITEPEKFVVRKLQELANFSLIKFFVI